MTDSKILWKDVFMALTLRAFKRIHYTYGIWGLGQQLYDEFNPHDINQNDGLLLANETAVCDSITQEFINSPLTNGAYLEKQIRYYSIFREVEFALDKASGKSFGKGVKKKPTKTVDLFVNRYKMLEEDIQISQMPVLIEAKRYHYFIPNLKEGKPKYKGTNESSIKKDINYLRQINEYFPHLNFDFKNIEAEKFFIYVLFWGLLNKDKPFEMDPLDIIETKFQGYLKAGKNHTRVEFLPIKWDGTTVTDWIWICLSEIDHQNRRGVETPFISLKKIKDL